MNGSEESPGSKLLALCSGAERELVLVAPFVKVRSLRRLLSQVSPGVDVTCVTRWRPEEVASGVSDLEVFDEMVRRDGAALLLSPRLHGKYFRADERCLVGSANLTHRALGWSVPPNIELLLEEQPDRPDLAHFEELVLESSCQATEELKLRVAAAAALIRTQLGPVGAPGETIDGQGCYGLVEPLAADRQIKVRTWLPSLRHPQDLYLAYRGLSEQLSRSSRLAAAGDLAVIDPAPRLSQPSFEAAVGIALLQMPMIVGIDQLLAEPQRFGVLRDMIAMETGASKDESSFMWQTTMRWLMHFLPHRYVRRVPGHSEVFAREPPPQAPRQQGDTAATPSA